MNKTRLIYFLSAFVLIVGCYALNQSYSMFVQTETINNVDSIVPTLSYSLGDNNLTIDSFNIKGNSEELVKVKINNFGTIDIKYVLSLVEKVDGVNVELVKLENNSTVGSLSKENSKYVWFKVTNTNLDDKQINFSLVGTYYTLNIENDDIISKTNIDLENLYELSLKDNIIINGINASIDKTLENKSMFVEDTKLLSEINNRGTLLLFEEESTDNTDDNSYYFNGNVKDNYINFANMCYRIVSINKDGSIKLILEDIDNVCQESNGNFSIPLNEETLGNNEIMYNGTYGYQINSNDQIIGDYINSTVNNSMIYAFKNFQITLSDYLSYMKINDVCVDNNLYEDEYGERLVTDLDTNYMKWIKMYYKTYTDIKNNQISLKCNGVLVNKFNDMTDIYVSTLTANEVIFAGINDGDNNGNYLMNDYSILNQENGYNGVNFWTLSPSYFDGLRSYAYSVNSNGKLVSTDLLNDSISFRPTIVLNDIKLISGNGLKTSPYIVLEETLESVE